MIELVEIPGKGWGLMASEPIGAFLPVEKNRALLIEIPKDKPIRECVEEPWGHVFPWSHTHWCIAIGNLSFINHSYDPNCTWWVDRRTKTVNAMAIRRIEAGEELTIDYCFTDDPWFEVLP